ncbi:MAG: response regulator transcription factor [Anaerolineales bacterium]|nr:response regulator transcription factor [Anaerolineales bacterium]
MAEQNPIRVLVVDDHVVVRQALCALVDSWPELTVVGEASDGIEAVIQAREKQPDVVLIDLLMPRMGGVEAIREILGENPNIQVLVLTSYSEDESISMAIQAGALGYLLKESSSQELIDAIFDVYNGKLVLHPAITRKVIRRLGRPDSKPPVEKLLTPREVDVLRLVATGMSNKGIAEELCLSEWTVTKHVSSLLSKLDLENRTQAALYALRTELVTLN